jgi:hypothetical protein
MDVNIPDLRATGADMQRHVLSGQEAGARPREAVRFYDAGLDLLRFLAFLMVFSLHAHKLHVSAPSRCPNFIYAGFCGSGLCIS